MRKGICRDPVITARCIVVAKYCIMENDRLHIMLSAFACNPREGSESGVGWNWLKEISKENAVWVFILANKIQEKEVERAVSFLSYNKHIHIIAVEFPKYYRIVQDILNACNMSWISNSQFYYYLGYELWQRRIFKIAKKIAQEVRIDIVHLVTLAAWHGCGYLWKLNIPFIFGPITGAQKTPLAGYHFLPLRGKIQEAARSFLFNIIWKLWPNPRHAIKKAEIVIVANPETKRKIEKIRENKPILFLTEVGADSTIENAGKTYQPASRVNLLWVARLIHRKNFGLLSEVLYTLPANIDWSLRVVGDGGLLEYWRKKTRKKNLEKRITFLGKVNHQELSEHYSWADIFVFPSLREATGTSLIEAMSYGLPVISLDLHGASVVLDDTCGIKVPIKNKNQMIHDFREAILALCYNNVMRINMGKSAMLKINEKFLWRNRGEAMNRIYHEILLPRHP